VNCQETTALLSAYVDRELDVASSLAMDAHLATCRDCAAAVERAEALRTAIRSAALSYPAPPELAPRVRAALRRDGRARGAALTPWAWRWASVPAAAFAAAAVAWLAVVNLNGAGGQRRLLDDLVAGHVRSLMVDHLVDVTSSDQHTVRPWFNGKIDFAPPVADHAASGFPLIGGRVDYVGGRSVAAIVYGHRQHLINVFVWPTGGEQFGPREITVEGYHLLHWADGGLEYWMVSDLNGHELGELAELIRQSRA
jgi:anti-sigma factor RsiW